ncbi:unnamed protein product [Ectocarpus sp. 4 AP-2014]
MPPREHAGDRYKILGHAADMIFKLMCDRATSRQCAEWLRAPLQHAAGTANQDLAEKLLKSGVDGSVGWRGFDDKTCLHAAAEGGNEEVVTALIRASAGRDIEATTPGTAGNPLHVAAATGKEAAAQVLMFAGADVNAVDRKNNTPLHTAIGKIMYGSRTTFCSVGPIPKPEVLRVTALSMSPPAKVCLTSCMPWITRARIWTLLMTKARPLSVLRWREIMFRHGRFCWLPVPMRSVGWAVRLPPCMLLPSTTKQAPCQRSSNPGPTLKLTTYYHDHHFRRRRCSALARPC